jgi:hypothetical protein
MTADTFNMEDIYLINHPDLLLNAVRRVLSAERNEQLYNIIVRTDECSLSYRVYIRMFLGPNGGEKMVTDSFEAPAYTGETNRTIIYQRCLKLIDCMVRAADK